MYCLRCCLVAAAGLTTGLLAGVGKGQPPEPAPEGMYYPHGAAPVVAPWAHPTNGPGFVGYYVGGGCPFWHVGEARAPQEGTWGWDYSGQCLWRKVELLWWHGRYQGGTGAYKTDGPKLLHAHDEGAH